MIERYTRPEMGQIWTLENRYKAWLRVELAVCEAWCQEGKVPAGALANIKAKAAIDVDRILTIEETTRHDVIAFLTSLEEKIGPDARFIHLGCTSSDIVDTAGALLLVQSGRLILQDLDALLETLRSMAFKYKGALCIGRSHGVHAEPTSFGLKMTGFYAEFVRHRARIADAIEDIRVGKNAVRLCRFRDDTDALLDEVAEADLRFSAYILFCQLLHNLTVQIKTSCERRIRLNGDSM